MQINIGKFKISIHNFGNFKLDGGSMFGAVPKNIWEKIYTPDYQNRITLATNCLIVEFDKRKILIDDGLGTKFLPKYQEIFGIEKYFPLPNPETITDIIFTHLHFDHCGGISYFDGDILRPTYKNAIIHIQKDNLDLAKNPNEREKASYLKENVDIIVQSKLNIINGAAEIYKGIKVYQSNGHTKGLQWIKIEDNDQVLCFPSDLVPTSRHIPLTYHLGYDMNVEALLQEKKDFLENASKYNWQIVFQHDPDVRTGYIVKDHNKFILK